MLSMYLLGIVVALLMAWLFKKTLLKGETPMLIMELPPYKRPVAERRDAAHVGPFETFSAARRHGDSWESIFCSGFWRLIRSSDGSEQRFAVKQQTIEAASCADRIAKAAANATARTRTKPGETCATASPDRWAGRLNRSSRRWASIGRSASDCRFVCGAGGFRQHDVHGLQRGRRRR